MLQRLKRKIKKGSHHENGQSLVEFALILPLLVTIMMLAMECGWVFYQQNSLEQMADAIAQSVDETSTQGQIEDYVRQYYSRYNLGDLQFHAWVNLIHLDYDEYIYRSDEDSHWKVPMYYDKMLAKLEVTYDLKFITPWGKYIFGTSGNEKVLRATGVSVRIIGNDSR